MRKLISEKTAALSVIIILSLIVIFHLLIISGVIPFAIVWGGRLTSWQQMIGFETISIVINLIMLFIVAVRGGMLRTKINRGPIKIALWLMVILFALNTVGNLLSNNQLEKLIFTPLTIILAILCLRLAMRSGNHIK